MDNIKDMIKMLPDNYPVILNKGGIEYSVSKQEYIEMLKNDGVF